MTLWCLLLATSACSTDAIPTAPSGPEQNRLIATVSIKPGDLLIAPDETFNLSAVVQGARGQVVNGRPVTWASSDESVARIDQLGNVVAGREGTATVRANVEGVVGTATVDVRGEVVSIEIDAPQTAFSEGSYLNLEATYVYRNGARRPAGSLRWLVLDPDRLLVDGRGRVRGLRPGFASVQGQGRGSGGTLELKVQESDESSVTMSADEIIMAVGDTVRLWTDVEDKDGNRLTRKVKWSSSDPVVADVDDEGLVTAFSLGDATIYAKSGDLVDSTLVAVVDDGSTEDNGSTDDGSSTTTTSSSTSLPGTVSDLGVKSSYTSYNSVTLRFTEVDDGTGSPADYVVRYMESPIDWSAALDVTEGTCAVPLTGSSIGATRTCTVEGLQASTGYDFQIVAYRGTLGEDAVYGALSNVATETTSDAPIVVDVVPSSFEVDVEQTKQLEATVTDVYGEPVDATVTWSTSSSTVATVDGSGLVTGEAAGDATITAKAEDGTDSSDATVSSTSTSSDDGGTTSSMANEPSSFAKLTERGFDAYDENGWNDFVRKTEMRIVSDETAPRSSAAAGQMVYPEGVWEDGSLNPAVAEYDRWSSSEVYFAVWFKVSSNWEGHPNGVNKVFYITDSSSGNGGDPLFMAMRGIGSGTLRLAFMIQNPDLDPTARNLTWDSPSNLASPASSDVEVRRGEWHLIEAHIVMNSGGNVDGQLHAWVNGRKVLEFQDVQYVHSGSDHAFDNIRWEPIWGGSGGEVPSEMYQFIDHFYVSVR